MIRGLLFFLGLRLTLRPAHGRRRLLQFKHVCIETTQGRLAHVPLRIEYHRRDGGQHAHRRIHRLVILLSGGKREYSSVAPVREGILEGARESRDKHPLALGGVEVLGDLA
eukprot:scaffold241517_cov28-Tisochrysis_lutea.AAC.1